MSPTLFKNKIINKTFPYKWFGSAWFYGTSTIVGYLIPNPFLYI